MGKKCDRSDFDCGLIFGARWAGLSISETAYLISWDFHAQKSLEFTQNKKKKNIQ